MLAIWMGIWFGRRAYLSGKNKNSAIRWAIIGVGLLIAIGMTTSVTGAVIFSSIRKGYIFQTAFPWILDISDPFVVMATCWVGMIFLTGANREGVTVGLTPNQECQSPAAQNTGQKVIYVAVVLAATTLGMTLLLLCNPEAILEPITHALRVFVARSSAALLNLVGIQTYSRDTVIFSRGGVLDVGAPHSMGSLIPLLTELVMFTWATQSSLWKRWVLLLFVIPAFLMGHIARSVLVLGLGYSQGQDVAATFYRNHSKLVIHGVALATLAAPGLVLYLLGRLAQMKRA